MEFYTYPYSIKNNYSIINCKSFIDFKNKKIKWNKIKDLSHNYKKVFLEPEVFILRKQTNYRFDKWLDVNNFLINLPENCYFSLDYPSDMNLNHQHRFITKTHYNIEKYHYSKQYINTVQSLFFNFESFKINFNIVNKIPSKSKIIGLGNICRLFNNKKETIEYILNTFNYIKNNINKNNYNWIHIYGLGLRFIKPYYDILKDSFKTLSFDSTKWTKACNDNLKHKFGLNCNKDNRQIFFNEYIKTIQNRNVPVKY